jgi:hypothetical protein
LDLLGVAALAGHPSPFAVQVDVFDVEHAQGLLHGWAGRSLRRRRGRPTSPAAYLVVRLEVAGRHVGLALLDPARPPDLPVARHLRTDAGAELLEWLTRSRWIR